MGRYTIGISEMHISDSPDDMLITYSLGSCVGVSMYDPDAVLGGLIHCMLPMSKIDPARARLRPCMFIDTGITLMLQELLNKGANKQRLVVKVGGAASLMNDDSMFRIGERNIVILRKLLWKNKLLITAEETGGTVARTMALYMDTGKTTLKVQGKEYEL